MKTKRIYIAILLIIIISTQGGYGKISKTEAPTYGEIGDVVKEAFLTDKGFNDELSKHMTKEVFNKTNIYNTYPVIPPLQDVSKILYTRIQYFPVDSMQTSVQESA